MNGPFQPSRDLFEGAFTRQEMLRRTVAIAGLLCFALSLTSIAGWSQTAAREVAPPPPDIMITTRLDHTAIWIGDQFHYFITVGYPPNYEFVLDNLTKETVNMDPFQVVDVRYNVMVQKNSGRRLFVDLTLANFAAAPESLQIPQFTLYYFRKDSSTVTVDQSDAESLTVPGPVVGIRSTLPPAPTEIRDAVTVNSWDRNRWVLPALAWVCCGFLVIGSAWEAAQFVKRRRARKGPDPRKAMQAIRTQWTAAVPSEFTDPKTCSSFYDRSYQNLKEYIGYYLDTSTLGLTSDEMQEEMKRLGLEPDLARKVTKVLESCEQLRYRRDGVSVNADMARALASDMRDILNFKVRQR